MKEALIIIGIIALLILIIFIYCACKIASLIEREDNK